MSGQRPGPECRNFGLHPKTDEKPLEGLKKGSDVIIFMCEILLHGGWIGGAVGVQEKELGYGRGAVLAWTRVHEGVGDG